MSIKEKNKIINITLTHMHQKKLGMICNRTGFSKSEVIQRLIEQHSVGMLEKIILGEVENPPNHPQVDQKAPPPPDEEVEHIKQVFRTY